MNKKEILDNLKKLSAEIGKIEIQRRTGNFISIFKLEEKKKEFYKLQKTYQKEVRKNES